MCNGKGMNVKGMEGSDKCFETFCEPRESESCELEEVEVGF
jgi:hypothetical protein